MLTVQDVYDFINGLAPFDTQESFDNAGLLVGHPASPVTGIHVAMDVTQRVLDEAEAAHANLIVTHHPLMFGGTHRLLETDYEGRLLSRLIRGNMALIAAHTNLDRAPGGINDVLAGRLELHDVTGEGYLRIGSLPQPLSAQKLIDHAAAALHTVVRPMGDVRRPIARVAVSSGSGSDAWAEAARLGADAFITGEMKHHHALALADAGLLGLEAGHHATEEPGIFALADALQNHLNAVKYSVCVTKSRVRAYAAPAQP